MVRKSIHDIERSIIKTYRKHIWVKFIRAIQNYQLLEPGDKVAVAISGGKDSLLMAKLFQEIKRHGKDPIDLEFICMDPGYRPEIRQQVLDTCKGLGIPVKIHDSDIFEVSERISDGKPCYMCARMRRGNLYAKAQELGCNKLALGHHFNDVIETILLNVLFSGNYKTMMPKLHAENFENIELIRPMYLIEEEYIIRFMKNTGYEAINCACTVTEKEEGNMRFFVKDLIEDLRKINPNVDISIFRSAENVNLDGIIGWKKDDEKYSFLDIYKGGSH
ncbi:MAG: ATP-binding protein [Tissierellia bacterium]|nr:ATP-binding protein [Tissierellia bacterium]